MDKLFGWPKEAKFQTGLSSEEFLPKTAHFLAELNAIHPFREGNGRTQVTFLVLLATRAGRTVDLRLLRPKRFLAAMIASFDGNEEPLQTDLATFLS